MEQNVKGAVWTVDDSEFYKRRPQRSSSTRSKPAIGGATTSVSSKGSATGPLRSVASTSQFSTMASGVERQFSSGAASAGVGELASSASTPTQMHTLRL